MEELKDGHPDCMTDNIGVQPAVFSKLEQKLVLKGGLLPSRWVDTSEMLAIFLYWVVTNSAIRKMLEFDVDLLTFSFQVFYLHVTLVTLSGCSLHPLSLYVVFRFLPFYIYTYWYLDVLFH